MNRLMPTPQYVFGAFARAYPEFFRVGAMGTGQEWAARVMPDDRPLAGHRGDCATVLRATVTGEMTAACDCTPPLDGHTFDCAKVALAMMTGVVTGRCDCQDRK